MAKAKEMKIDDKNSYINNIKDKFYDKLYLLICEEEGRLVSCLWRQPELFFEAEIESSDFIDNNWRTVFCIGNDIITKEGGKTLKDPQIIENYLSKHQKMKKIWDEIEGHETFDRISELSEAMNYENYDTYLQNHKKLLALNKMVDSGMAIIDEKSLSRYMDMSIDDIYDEYEFNLNDIFSNSISSVKSYDIYDHIEESIEEWNEGLGMGLLMNGLEHFSQSIGGIPDGNITLIGGISNAGKSSLVRTTIFPIMIPSEEDIKVVEEKRKEYEKAKKKDPTVVESDYIDVEFENKTVFFLNEEDISKWQKELIIWIINNKLLSTLGVKFSKNVLTQGDFLEHREKDPINYKRVLFEAVDWMKKYIPKGHIKFVPLPKFSTGFTIKLIKKYATIGYKNFIIDTFKMDNTDDSKIDNNTRLQLVQNMTHLYNAAKKEGGKNVRIICTVQLSKAYTLQRYLSQECLAESKNMIDVCALGVFMRKVWSDEVAGGTKELHYKKYNDKSDREYTLAPGFNYVLLFPVKTREGSCDYQCVARVDWGTNTIEELGYVCLSPE